MKLSSVRTARIALAATTAAALCFAGSASAKDIKVCLIAGKSGPLEAYAKQTEAGFMMGLEFLTKGTMKVGNDKIEVLVKDDQLKPDRGKALLEECYDDDKVDLAVGTTGSPVALAMLPVAEERKKVLIVEPAVADSITGDEVEPLHLPHRPLVLSGRTGGSRRDSRQRRRCDRHARPRHRLRPRRRQGVHHGARRASPEGQGGR